MISRIIKVEIGVISRSWRLRLITLTKTLIILDITKAESSNCSIIHWIRKLGSHVSASSLMASNTSRAKLTWLPLEIMHCGHSWHDYLWPWHDCCIICSYGVKGRRFWKFAVRFRRIKKELESSMYNNLCNRYWSKDWNWLITAFSDIISFSSNVMHSLLECYVDESIKCRRPWK